MSKNLFNDPLEDLIVRFLDGYASPEETKQLENWKAESAENQKVFDDMQRIWTSSAIADMDQIDVEADWQRFQSTIDQNKSTSTVTTDTVIKKEATVRRFPVWISRVAAAAALLLVAMGGWYFVNQNSGNTIDPSSKQEIILADGTQVWLNKGATLDYPEKFNGHVRRVKLHGEAFFEVHHNPAKPFIVETNNSKVEVLGTSFNIQQKGKNVDVAVKTGKVKFTALVGESDPVILTPGESANYNQKIVTKKDSANPNYLSWKTGAFTFVNQNLSTVIHDLETFYDKDIKLDVDSDCQLTANFANDDLAHIAKTIQRICNLKVKQTKKQLIFY